MSAACTFSSPEVALGRAPFGPRNHGADQKERGLWGQECRVYCRISYREGLGTSPCIMGLTTQDPYIQKEHTEFYKILKFRVNWANIEQDTAIQKLKNLVTNVWIAGHLSILGDPGAVNGGARKINRRDERFHESLQGGVKEPLGTDSHQTISKRLGECWLLIGQKIPLYYSAQSANGSF